MSTELINGLTPKQHAFVLALIEDPQRRVDKAAIAAGYSDKNAMASGRQLMKNPKVASVIREYEAELAQQVIKQLSHYAVRAAQVLGRVLNDPHASNNDKIKAAKDILDRTGHGATQKVSVETKTFVVKLPDEIEKAW
jgi:phage terminase small subunit